ncbi:restriction endonuclease [Salimicrobium halophilum]|uniref:Restriction system protein n=1 Tax=Salimicrobium halophilum TaxID=86666 RepID=A0A1G8UI02_9BACI|nr:restriction endonuclease [Salimicrobium halophilum]SDJ53388.1 restriction system protein [Salimicrobium halophilum]
MTYRQMYEVEIKHDGLNKYRVIRGAERHVVEQKAQTQLNQWDEMWKKKVEAEEKRAARERKAQEKEEKKQYAFQQTEEAENQLQQIEDILKHTLDVDDTIDWEDLKDKRKFDKPKPKAPENITHPPEPDENDQKFQPQLNLLEKMISSMREKKEKEMEEKYLEEKERWKEEVENIEKENQNNNKEYEQELKEWKAEKKEFEAYQKETNEAIEEQRRNYLEKDPTAIIDYCDMVLSNSEYPDEFPQEFDIDYNPETKILIVDYSLPSPEDMSTLKEVKYVQARDEFKKVYLSEAAQKKMYDRLLYNITLRSLHELFEADTVNALEAVVFNGWVNSIDKATGQEVNACVLSIQANKEEFEEINLEQVDPKLCFKNLKGVGSSKLHSLSPVAPIIKIDRDDPRFVSSYAVSEGIDENMNIAAMDWQDFENLIRELFEKEFNQAGGEVNITRASRDGGVDAVAFDPDPLRGGKMVIQAKRYTNVVGVSAVRDLYGTVMNEGATKGILVSTADYGPDAYNFAKDKPLTLLNGNNLLHLLQKHGQKAKIDLQEAKKELKEKEL